MIITRTPFRISFFGGGTDYPPWFRENGGAVLATSIDKYCYISMRYLPPFFEHRHRLVYSKTETVQHISEIKHPSARAVLELKKITKGIEIHHDGDLPARSGIGTSSSFTVCLLHAVSALGGRYMTREELARTAIHVEQDIIRENVGSQDQVTAAFGGFNKIEFKPDGSFQVDPVILPPSRMDQLQSHMMLFFTRIQRTASDVAKHQIDNIANRKKELHRMRKMVGEGLEILNNPQTPIAAFGELLDEAWRYKRSLSDYISTPLIDDIYEKARGAGAIGGKILGAGGGGFFLLFAPPERHAAIIKKLENMVHVPFRFEQGGSRVLFYQPSGIGGSE